MYMSVILKPDWINLNVQYIGPSKKNYIFRAPKFTLGQFNINGPVFDKELNKIGKIKDIFGPVQRPYISIQTDPQKKQTDLDLGTSPLYTKLEKSKIGYPPKKNNPFKKKGVRNHGNTKRRN